MDSKTLFEGEERKHCLLIGSVATTLGLARVSAQTLKLVKEHAVSSEVVTDQEAVKAVERFVGELQTCYFKQAHELNENIFAAEASFFSL